MPNAVCFWQAVQATARLLKLFDAVQGCRASKCERSTPCTPEVLILSVEGCAHLRSATGGSPWSWSLVVRLPWAKRGTGLSSLASDECAMMT